MPTATDPAFVAALVESLTSLAGPRRWNASAAYARAVAAAVAAHPAVIAYIDGLRDVAEKARRVDATGDERTADFDAALRDLRASLDRLEGAGRSPDDARQ